MVRQKKQSHLNKQLFKDNGPALPHLSLCEKFRVGNEINGKLPKQSNYKFSFCACQIISAGSHRAMAGTEAHQRVAPWHRVTKYPKWLGRFFSGKVRHDLLNWL